jgi:hypothetical protein
MFDRIDRVPRGYAATREREPVRMESQNQFMPSRSRPKVPVTVISGRWRVCCEQAAVRMLGCSWAQGGGCQDEMLKARCRAPTDDFYGQGCKGGLIMGKGKAHIRWWGRNDCNFSVVLETSTRQSQLEASTGPPLRSRARVKGG